MGEILGLGMTHYPPLTGLDQNMAIKFRFSVLSMLRAGAMRFLFSSPQPQQHQKQDRRGNKAIDSDAEGGEGGGV